MLSPHLKTLIPKRENTCLRCQKLIYYLQSKKHKLVIHSFDMQTEVLPASSTSQYNNNSLSNPIRLSLYRLSFIICVCLCISILPVCSCTEIQIVSRLTDQHLKTINLMKSLRKIRVRYINLQNDTYACVTALKQKSLDLKLEANNKSKQINQLVTGNLPTVFPVDKSLFQEDLNILDDGMVLRQTTKQFIYGYKHKKIVSQFDDDITKYNNQKKQHQNFTMGLFSLDLLTQGKVPEKVSLQSHTYDNDYLKTFMNRNILQNKLDNSKQKPVSNRYVHEALKHAHIDYLNSLLVLTQPLSTLRHQKSVTYNVTFQCEQQMQNEITFYNYTIIGVSLTNYQILMVSNIPLVCKRALQIVEANVWILSFVSGINVFDDKLMGDLEQVCGISYDKSVHPGDYILLKTERSAQFTQNLQQKQILSFLQENVKIQKDGRIRAGTQKSQKSQTQKKNEKLTEYFLVRIEEIIGENLYTINTKIPWTVKPKSCSLVEFKPHLKIDYGGQINLGLRKATKEYEIANQQSNKLLQFDFLNMKMIKNLNSKKPTENYEGKNLFCVREALFVFESSNPNLQSFSLTVGTKIGKDYYEIYPWVGQNYFQVYEMSGWLGTKLNCIAYQQQLQGKQNNRDKKNSDDKSLYANPIYKILKLSKNKMNRVKFENPNNPVQTEVKTGKQGKKINSDSIITATLSEDAIVQIHTQIVQKDEQIIEQDVSPADFDEAIDNKNKQQSSSNKKVAVVNKYLVNRHKIYKCQTHFKNGTKIKIERMENQFYENNTNENSIIIYRSIWRSGDFVKFPRFLFKENQKITQIVVRFGSAFLRISDLSIINRQVFTVSSSEFQNYKGFGPFHRPAKSISTQYTFKHGNFCGGNINKNRQTTIKMKCGQSWYKLVSVTELSPCVYQIVIATQFLCDRSVNFPALKNGFNIFPGSICLPAQSFTL